MATNRPSLTTILAREGSPTFLVRRYTVYLRTKKVGLPSLARIVVSDGRLVAMDRDLNLALDQLMKKAPPV